MNGFVIALNSCGAQKLILLTLHDADSPFFRSTHLKTYYVHIFFYRIHPIVLYQYNTIIIRLQTQQLS